LYSNISSMGMIGRRGRERALRGDLRRRRGFWGRGIWIGICEWLTLLTLALFFVCVSGMAADVGRMAYIDSELAKRRRREEGIAAGQQPPLTGSTTITTTTAASSTSPVKDRNKGEDLQRQPAALGKLLEIDLGDEARDRNVQRTNQARRRMDGEVVEDEDEQPKGKVRLGRDGKPWRGRKRRGSEDVKRDKLVEEFLRENRCECGQTLPLPSFIHADGYLHSGHVRRASDSTNNSQ
jgi:hypothetical protein